MEFRVLGPVEMGPLGAPVVLRGHRRRGVLAVLLLRANQVVSTAELVQTLWAEPTVAAESNVRTQVTVLRRLLDKHDDELPGRLTTEASGYRLAVRPGELDLAMFEELVDEGERALRHGAPGDALSLLDQAQRLWRGPALDGTSDSPALLAHASRLEERRLTVAESWADAAIAAGRPGEAVAELRALLAANPLRERTAALLMTALVEAGEPAAALTTYQQLRTELTERLGTDPAPGLQRLHQRILRNEPVRETTARQAVPRQLPADPPGFTGRSAELARLDQLSEAGAVIVLAGTAGVGKTALAVRWAAGVAERFPDGTLYVDLRGFGAGRPVEPAQALSRLLHALGTAPEAVPAEPDEAAALYRSLLAHRRTLVVLDNAVDEEQVRPLLPGGAGCLVLVTSRRRLRGLVARDGAQLLDLDVLPTEEAVGLLAGALGQPAQPRELAELAEVCGRLPLALRIAAANLADEPARPTREYLEHLTADRLGALRIDGDPDSVVGAAFDHSYRRLPGDDARLFRLLGVVPAADFGVPAVAALTDTSHRHAAAVLRRLAAAHLIEPTGIDPAGADRYGMHDLLRAYAADRAAGDLDAEPARRQLFDWFLATADRAARLGYPDVVRLLAEPAGTTDFASAQEARDWLDAERDALLAVAREAAAHGPYPVAWRLADALRGYLTYTRPGTLWRSIALTALEAADRADDVTGRLVGLLTLGDVNRWQSRFAEAREAYQRARDLAAQASDAVAQATALLGLGRVAMAAGSPTEAIEHHAAALELYRQTGNRAGEASALGNIGFARADAGQPEQAAEYMNGALALHRELGFAAGEAVGALNLGVLRFRLGDVPAARALYEQALDLVRRTGVHRVAVEPMALSNLAEACLDTGEYELAERHATAALDLARDVGDDRVIGDSLINLGNLALARGEQRAATLFAEALRLARQIGASASEAAALANLSRALDPTDAVRQAREAVSVARRYGLHAVEPDCLLALAEATLADNRPEAAAELASEAATRYRAIGDRRGEARARSLAARSTGTGPVG